MTRILVAYASAAGCTRSVAEAIGKELGAQGASVDVLSAGQVREVDDYDAVVVGSGIHAGSWYGEALKFISRNAKALPAKPVAYFVTCATLHGGMHRHHQTAQSYVDQVARKYPKIRPVATGLFAGAVDYQSIGPIQRMILQWAKVDEGDWRDWDEIRAWAAKLHDSLAQACVKGE